MTDVLLDNKYVGTIRNPKEFVEQVVSERRMGRIVESRKKRQEEWP